MQENEDVPFGEDVIACPFKRVLAVLVGVDGHRHQMIAVVVTAVAAAVVAVATP